MQFFKFELIKGNNYTSIKNKSYLYIYFKFFDFSMNDLLMKNLVLYKIVSSFYEF